MKTAFSTIACPGWTFERVAELAASLGVDGVELRTFGTGTSPLVCEPWQTGTTKVRDLLGGHGVVVSAVATAIRYDAVVFPPVLGHALTLTDTHPSVRDSKDSIELAVGLESPFVRVFGFETAATEARHSGIARISDRLTLALACARHTGVRLMLENGGTYSRASDLVEIIDGINNPLLAACYSPAVAHLADEDPVAGIRMLGDRLVCVKLRDLAPAGDSDAPGTRRPCVLGDGDMPIKETVQALAAARYRGWLTIEHDCLWADTEMASPEDTLRESLRRVYEWWGQAAPAAGKPSAGAHTHAQLA